MVSVASEVLLCSTYSLVFSADRFFRFSLDLFMGIGSGERLVPHFFGWIIEPDFLSIYCEYLFSGLLVGPGTYFLQFSSSVAGG